MRDREYVGVVVAVRDSESPDDATKRLWACDVPQTAAARSWRRIDHDNAMHAGSLVSVRIWPLRDDEEPVAYGPPAT